MIEYDHNPCADIKLSCAVCGEDANHHVLVGCENNHARWRDLCEAHKQLVVMGFTQCGQCGVNSAVRVVLLEDEPI